MSGIVINGLEFWSLKRKGGYLTKVCKDLDYAYRCNVAAKTTLEPDPWDVEAGDEYCAQNRWERGFGIHIYRSRVTKLHYAEFAMGFPLTGAALSRVSAAGGPKARERVQARLLDTLFEDLDGLLAAILDLGAQVASSRQAQHKAAGLAGLTHFSWRSEGARLVAATALQLGMPSELMSRENQSK